MRERESLLTCLDHCPKLASGYKSCLYVLDSEGPSQYVFLNKCLLQRTSTYIYEMCEVGLTLINI